MPYTFTEMLYRSPIRGLLQASAYDECSLSLAPREVDKIVQLAKTWGATGVRLEGMDGLTYEETDEWNRRRDGVDKWAKGMVLATIGL